jgi:hypothetical protein
LEFNIYTTQGVLIRKENISAIAGTNHLFADLKNYQSGIYILQLSGRNGSVQKKFVKM